MGGQTGHTDPGPKPIVVVVIDASGCRLGPAVEEDDAYVLWATMSEDPANWDELASYWPRYRCPGVCEFLDGLAIGQCDRVTAMAAINGHENWLVFDLVQKRLFTGDAIDRLDRDATLTVTSDRAEKGQGVLPFHLAPWWELHQGSSPSSITSIRESELSIPRTNRHVLFGQPMIQYFANALQQFVIEGQIQSTATHPLEDSDPFDSIIVAIHKNWLMSPRDDLGGSRPRDHLHGAHGWSDRVIWGQQVRFAEGSPLTACPTDVLNYETAPMGSEEMIIYFDLCRELLKSGLQWCQRQFPEYQEHQVESIAASIDPLVTFLSQRRDHWLQEPLEGGSPPCFIIECSRRRVPRASGVPIAGMEHVEAEQHIADCDCPICQMMDDGMFGVSFAGLDGYHLDAEDEFAFATQETMEEWEAEQCQFEGPFAANNLNDNEPSQQQPTSEFQDDVYQSAWSSPGINEPLPADPLGHLALAFRLAELNGDLAHADAEQSMIRKLNAAFRAYREGNSDTRQNAKLLLYSLLESCAQQYPELTPKIADFQSQADNLERQA